MTQVQVAIRLGREAGNNRLVLARVDVGLNNFLQKIQTQEILLITSMIIVKILSRTKGKIFIASKLLK